MSNDVACFTFFLLMWPIAVESPRDTSSGEYKSLPTKEVLLPMSEILFPSESRASDAHPSSEMSSSSIYHCVNHDVMEGSSSGAILKPG